MSNTTKARINDLLKTIPPDGVICLRYSKVKFVITVVYENELPKLELCAKAKGCAPIKQCYNPNWPMEHVGVQMLGCLQVMVGDDTSLETIINHLEWLAS